LLFFISFCSWHSLADDFSLLRAQAGFAASYILTRSGEAASDEAEQSNGSSQLQAAFFFPFWAACSRAAYGCALCHHLSLTTPKRSGPNALPTHNPRYPKFLLRSVAARHRVPIIEDFPTLCIRASHVPLREWKPYSVPKVLCICMNRLPSFC
jgi:hypothetical protein